MPPVTISSSVAEPGHRSATTPPFLIEPWLIIPSTTVSSTSKIHGCRLLSLARCPTPPPFPTSLDGAATGVGTGRPSFLSQLDPSSSSPLSPDQAPALLPIFFVNVHHPAGPSTAYHATRHPSAANQSAATHDAAMDPPFSSPWLPSSSTSQCLSPSSLLADLPGGAVEKPLATGTNCLSSAHLPRDNTVGATAGHQPTAVPLRPPTFLTQPSSWPLLLPTLPPAILITTQLIISLPQPVVHHRSSHLVPSPWHRPSIVTIFSEPPAFLLVGSHLIIFSLCSSSSSRPRCHRTKPPLSSSPLCSSSMAQTTS